VLDLEFRSDVQLSAEDHWIEISDERGSARFSEIEPLDPAHNGSALLKRMTATSAKDLDPQTRRSMRAPLDSLPSALGPRESVERLAVAVHNGEPGLLAITADTTGRLLFFDAVSGILTIEFRSDARLGAGTDWIEISDNRGGVRLTDVRHAARPARRPDQRSSQHLPPLRRCVSCTSEFTPQYPGALCADCGGALEPSP
jgi:hypothetical protein